MRTASSLQNDFSGSITCEINTDTILFSSSSYGRGGVPINSSPSPLSKLIAKHGINNVVIIWIN